MDKKREFMYKGVPCTVSYDSLQKEFYLLTYSDNERVNVDYVINLFPVDRFSKSQLDTAFHVANRHVLPNLILKTK